MYEKIKKFYDMGLYTADHVHKLVDKGAITEEQYAEIVGGDGMTASIISA